MGGMSGSGGGGYKNANPIADVMLQQSAPWVSQQPWRQPMVNAMNPVNGDPFAAAREQPAGMHPGALTPKPFGMMLPGMVNPSTMPGMQQQMSAPQATTPAQPQTAAPTAPAAATPQKTSGVQSYELAAMPEDQRRLYSFDPETYTYYKSG